jgi:hypothetical protein
MILKILLLSSVILLSGCALFREPVKQIETVKVEVSKPALELPSPEPLKLRETKWVVVTRENAEQIFEELEASGEAVALFALTADGYEALSINIADIRTFIGTQKEIIIQYRDYYEGENNDKSRQEK